MTKSKRRWGGKTIYVRGVSQVLFVSPEGIEYVRATDRETPDLVIPAGGGLPPLRLRLYQHSRARKLAGPSIGIPGKGRK